MTGVILLRPQRFSDERGWFAETWSRRLAERYGIDTPFVQDNHSLSRRTGTVRGLHFQAPPRAQAKLVRCAAGRMMDVALDIRRGSPTYGRHLTAELSAANGYQLFIPTGFAHAFVTLEPDTEVVYKASDDYAPDREGGILWDSAGIDWPLPADGPTLSDRDGRLPTLAAFDSPFVYDGEPLADRLG